MRKFLKYNPQVKIFARKLRNQSTVAEILLWEYLKGKQRGYKFQRQKPVENYILDFFCRELFMAIEIDGESHEEKGEGERDKVRQANLEKLGIRFLRFYDEDVKESLEGVLEVIDRWIAEHGRRR